MLYSKRIFVMKDLSCRFIDFVVMKITGQGGFTKLTTCDFVGDIGPHEDPATKGRPHGLCNGLGDLDGRMGVVIKVCK
eukprot:scaffold2987_cov170-Amphora_coffeaeformis.AAC.22